MWLKPSRAIGRSRKASPQSGSGRTRRRSVQKSRLNSNRLPYMAAIRSDQATFQPSSGLPTNWRRITGLVVSCQAAWTSARESMGRGPKRKKERCGSWWHWVA
jgi:hypothetical protein